MNRSTWLAFTAALVLLLGSRRITDAAAIITPIVPADVAGANLIDFGTVETNAPIDGQTINGVQFSFLVNGVHSNNAVIDDGPGNTNNITVANVVNNSGNANAVIEINFPSPETRIGYGYAVLLSTATPAGTTVEVFNAANQSLGFLSPAISNPDPMFAGGFWGVKSDVGFVRANVTFTTAAPASAFDNLRYEFVGADVTPEPSTFVLSAVSLLGLAGWRRFARAAR
jgi:hypothetical protein